MSIPRIASYALPDSAQLPANRVGWQPDPARAALLIHDMQHYFLEFFDTREEPVPSLVANLLALRRQCDELGIPVFYTVQPPQQSPDERGLLQDWWGPGITAQPQLAPIVTSLSPREGDRVLTKWRYSAFAKSDFEQQLRELGRDQLIIGGVYAHIGCMTTAVDAFMRDIQSFLISDAVADFSLDQHQLAVNWVAQRCGMVLDTASALALLKPARLPDSLHALVAQVAALLQLNPAEVQPDDDLLLLGLDSVRLMSLLERWRSAGWEVELVALAEQPTLAAWWDMMSGAYA